MCQFLRILQGEQSLQLPVHGPGIKAIAAISQRFQGAQGRGNILAHRLFAEVRAEGEKRAESLVNLRILQVMLDMMQNRILEVTREQVIEPEKEIVRLLIQEIREDRPGLLPNPA